MTFSRLQVFLSREKCDSMICDCIYVARHEQDIIAAYHLHNSGNYHFIYTLADPAEAYCIDGG